MVCSVSSNRLLHQRYLIQHVLESQQSCRSYLAIDTQRNNRRCFVQEIPFSNWSHAGRLRQLRLEIHREILVMYQIRHPQIPDILAAFEEDEHLFLIQDYVEGPTLRDLRHIHREWGQRYSEADIVHILKHLLPVLSHIHERGVIHRNLSPDSIMMALDAAGIQESIDPTRSTSVRRLMGLPILVNFGSLGELTRQFERSGEDHNQSELSPVPNSSNARLSSYLPPDHQHEAVSPCTDLYGLAATCFFLLTGQDPHELIDARTGHWISGTSLQISNVLAAILIRMMAPLPSDRYQSAQDVLQAMAPLLSVPSFPPRSQPAIQSSVSEKRRIPERAQSSSDGLKLPMFLAFRLKTQTHSHTELASKIAISNLTSASLPANQARQRQARQRQQSRRSKSSSKKLAVWTNVGIAAGILVFAAMGVHRHVLRDSVTSNDVWISGTRIPRSQASELLGLATGGGVNPDPVDWSGLGLDPSHPFGLTPPISSQLIDLSTSDRPILLTDSLAGNSAHLYRIRLDHETDVSIFLEGHSATLELLYFDEQTPRLKVQATEKWEGTLSPNQDYLIQIVGNGTYRLTVGNQ
ncbi:MAG: serine/threonine protein kinase [Elainellaceae cyanobacterium]